MLLLGVGLLVQIPIISAQENASADSVISTGQTAENEGSVVDPLRAAEQAFTLEENTVTDGPAAGPSVWSVVRMILTLALVAVAIYGVVIIIRRSAKKTVSNDPFLKVLANAHLGSNRYAHIISVGSRAWLLGSSDGGVNLIGEIEDKDILNAMLLEDSRKTTSAASASMPFGRFPDFMGMLRRLGAPAETGTPSADDIQKRRERLKKL